MQRNELSKGRDLSHVDATAGVLEVLEKHHHRAAFGPRPKEADELAEARAAVAELIEAVHAIRATRGGTMALGAADPRTVRLWDALARVQGGAR